MKKICVLIALVAWLAVQVEAERVLSISAVIHKDDSATLEYMRLEDNNPTFYDYGDLGDYELRITDKAGDVLYTSSLPVSFVLFSDPPIEQERALIMARVPYDARMSRMSINKKGIELLGSEIDLCDRDGRCETDRESTLSCPSDCLPGAKDGLCNKGRDGVCDPDCYEGIDPDCAAGQYGMNIYFVIGLAIVVLVAALIYFTGRKSRRRK